MYTQLEQRGMEEPPVNVSTLTKMKIDGEPIACLTAYDASFALLVDRAGTDLILVGDSLGMVIQGHDTTVPVTVEDIIYHTRTVTRGLRRAFLVADMPFMSYSSKAQALDNAVRLMQEGGAMMVKLEGGAGQISIVEHLAHHDIPVCAHIGLRPQSVHKIGGFKVQGRDGRRCGYAAECRRGHCVAGMRAERIGESRSSSGSRPGYWHWRRTGCRWADSRPLRYSGYYPRACATLR
jgi:3-methyl-2-oxobutanoate hydroxymethyltransferase